MLVRRRVDAERLTGRLTNCTKRKEEKKKKKKKKAVFALRRSGARNQCKSGDT